MTSCIGYFAILSRLLKQHVSDVTELFIGFIGCCPMLDKLTNFLKQWKVSGHESLPIIMFYYSE